MKAEIPATQANAASRAGIRRTVWILAACAIGSYLLFLVSVMGGK